MAHPLPFLCGRFGHGPGPVYGVCSCAGLPHRGGWGQTRSWGMDENPDCSTGGRLRRGGIGRADDRRAGAGVCGPVVGAGTGLAPPWRPRTIAGSVCPCVMKAGLHRYRGSRQRRSRGEAG
jgi:hypothetical protein